ncbi:hypothetical protein TNCV_4921511 [Trichonephila clavipes]|nr:hypothetical protein TNCV_4921511 [Trichonephila clavipes]
MKVPSSGRGNWTCPRERRSTHVVLVVMIEGMVSVRSQPFETLKPLSTPSTFVQNSKDKESFSILLDSWGSSLTSADDFEKEVPRLRQQPSTLYLVL